MKRLSGNVWHAVTFMMRIKEILIQKLRPGPNLKISPITGLALSVGQIRANLKKSINIIRV